MGGSDGKVGMWVCGLWWSVGVLLKFLGGLLVLGLLCVCGGGFGCLMVGLCRFCDIRFYVVRWFSVRVVYISRKRCKFR